MMNCGRAADVGCLWLSTHKAVGPCLRSSQHPAPSFKLHDEGRGMSRPAWWVLPVAIHPELLHQGALAIHGLQHLHSHILTCRHHLSGERTGNADVTAGKDCCIMLHIRSPVANAHTHLQTPPE